MKGSPPAPLAVILALAFAASGAFAAALSLAMPSGGAARMLATALSLALIPGGPAPAAAEALPEEQVRATMLLQVIKFVEWPRESDLAQMRVCVVGSSRFGHAVEAAARNESWNGRPIAVATSERANSTAECQVIFVAAASDREIQSMIERRNVPALLVAAREGFARRGGMLNFVHDSGRIGIEANPASGERAGIRFSSKLLRLARIVTTGVVD